MMPGPGECNCVEWITESAVNARAIARDLTLLVAALSFFGDAVRAALISLRHQAAMPPKVSERSR